MYQYTPLNLSERVFRLVRIFRGRFHDDIECELFEAWFPVSDGGMPYEALSYAWGDTMRPSEVNINGKKLNITINLELALRHIRYKGSDRILWVDAICIDQENPKERGHQVQQMKDIYTAAERVIVWLGTSTIETDLVLDAMKRMQDGGNLSETSWKRSAEFWRDFTLANGAEWKDLSRLKLGLDELLNRSWFRRIWILQEIANARTAVIICGQKSIWAKVFALVPRLLAIQPSSQCQAVLDIMPSPSRKESWWNRNRDLFTLLKKFKNCEASEPRDMIYALLGLASDAENVELLRADYTKSTDQLVWDVCLFILAGTSAPQQESMPYRWTMDDFLEKLDQLEWEAIRAIAKLPFTITTQAVLDLALSQNLCRRCKRLVYDDTLILQLTASGYENCAKTLLIERKCKPNSAEKMLLRIAVTHGSTAVCNALLPRNAASVNDKNKIGETLLWTASRHGHDSVVDALLSLAKVDPNLGNRRGETALWIAARSGHEKVVDLLLRYPTIDPNIRNESQQTPLWISACHGHEAISMLLLSSPQIDITAQDEGGRDVLWTAAAHGHINVVEHLLVHPAINIYTKDRSGDNIVWAAALHNQLQMLKYLLGTCMHLFDVNATNDQGRCVLSAAIEADRFNVVGLLLSHPNININFQDVTGQTPLHVAASEDASFPAEMLLADPRIKVSLEDREGQTPLSIAAARECLKTLLLLLSHKDARIHVNKRDANGRTPIFLAAYYGRHMSVNRLLRHKDIDVNLQDDNGDTPLSAAAYAGHYRVVKQLLSLKNIDVKAKSHGGKTALDCAVKRGHESIVALLKSDSRLSMLAEEVVSESGPHE